jgi:sulfur relay (sulfurtransferase) complex TusBCD TusD component (DsrE family)
MTEYLLIGSRDPFESKDTSRLYGLAGDLARNGDRVTLFLVQDGVLAARGSACSAELSAVASEGVEVLADEFSLVERGISAARLVPGISSAPLDMVVDHLAEGRKTIWN